MTMTTVEAIGPSRFDRSSKRSVRLIPATCIARSDCAPILVIFGSDVIIAWDRKALEEQLPQLSSRLLSMPSAFATIVGCSNCLIFYLKIFSKLTARKRTVLFVRSSQPEEEISSPEKTSGADTVCAYVQPKETRSLSRL
ncbi:hypothetical protein K461DRAFT_275468 [Myriangium duriaei CBS 260.36]|uniref:Uncharacterized protein n=1 Tax=Myriangium duriaei CBS 260.36 TaxID=1168546 RepID=A0A9P4J947_9PEZI|nr:hypothetical protein K461DRAFT_275468 [Myriangium duriaei CBS 260.36]